MGAGFASIWLLRRFGLLAFVSFRYFRGIVPRLPVTMTGFFAGYSLLTLATVPGIAAWALYVIVKAQPAAGSPPGGRRAQATLTR